MLPISAKRAARGALACPVASPRGNRAPLAVHVRADSRRIAACGVRAVRPARCPSQPCAASLRPVPCAASGFIERERPRPATRERQQPHFIPRLIFPNVTRVGGLPDYHNSPANGLTIR